MGKHDFRYFFCEGIGNMFSHGFMSFAAIGITVACLVIMGTFTLVAVNADANLKELEQANEILGKIQSGEMKFEDAAMEFSTCPSAGRGGSLGEFGRGQMVPEFDEACFTMQVGELRGPIKTQFGFHLIRLDAANEAKPVKLEEVKEGIREHLMTEKGHQAYQTRINQLKLMYPVD